MKKIFFKKRIPEPQEMTIAEIKEFEKMSLDSYKKWMIPLVDDLLNYLKIKSETLKILDVGCGPGLLSKELSIRFPKAKITGIDISRYSIKLAKKNCKAIKNINFIIADVHKLPFPDEYFDLVVCKDSFHQFSNPIKAIKEMYRVLKPGGIIYIQDLRRDVPLYLIKMVLPPNTLAKKLIYYSARSSYLPKEIKKILNKAGIKRFILKGRKLTNKLKNKYRKIGIDINSLKDTFNSRLILIIEK
jgi:ubiquinone/menaquinone biosynthesis C-methylase UbiE